VLEPAFLGDLRGPFEPERQCVRHQSTETGGQQAAELDLELLLGGGMCAGEEIEWRPGL
jgi:hypothetical protein